MLKWLRPCKEESHLAKIRISIVEYLNTAPLVWGFTEGPQAARYDLSFTLPSQCAGALRGGDADVAIIPAIEYERIENLVMLPGMAVAAKREVRDGKDSIRRITARLKADAAKRALGERGPVWWTDGAPDYHRCLAINTPYASWFTGSG